MRTLAECLHCVFEVQYATYQLKRRIRAPKMGASGAAEYVDMSPKGTKRLVLLYITQCVIKPTNEGTFGVSAFEEYEAFKNF